MFPRFFSIFRRISYAPVAFALTNDNQRSNQPPSRRSNQPPSRRSNQPLYNRPPPPLYNQPPQIHNRNDQILQSLTKSIANQDNAVLDSYKSLNQKRSKIKRNAWILKFFTEFLSHHVPDLTPNDIHRIRNNNPLSLIPKHYFNDAILEQFVIYGSEEVQRAKLNYRGFIRAIHATISDTCKEYHLSNDLKQSNLFKTGVIFDGIQSKDEYRKDDSKQARACTDEEYKAILNISVIGANGRIDDMVLTEKAGFAMTTGFCIRGDEVHRGVDDDLRIAVDKEGNWFMDLKIFYDKSRSRFYHKSVFCAEPGKHNPYKYNDNACLVAVVQKYQDRKQDSIDYLKRFGRITSKKSMNILQNPGDGALFRRVFYNNQKNHSLGTYIGLQRRGIQKLNFIHDLAQRLGFRYDKRRGQKQNFTKHSGKRSGVLAVEREAGDILEDSDKLAISGHSNMKLYHQYANRGEYVVTNAAKKFAMQRRKASMNNNNDNIPPPLKPLSMNKNKNNIPPPFKPLPPLPTHLKIPFFSLEMHGGAVLSEMMNKENDIGGFGGEWDGSAVEADDKVANDNDMIEDDDVEITGFGCNSRYHVMSRCDNVKEENGNDFGDFYGDFDDCDGY